MAADQPATPVRRKRSPCDESPIKARKHRHDLPEPMSMPQSFGPTNQAVGGLMDAAPPAMPELVDKPTQKFHVGKEVLIRSAHSKRACNARPGVIMAATGNSDVWLVREAQSQKNIEVQERDLAIPRAGRKSSQEAEARQVQDCPIGWHKIGCPQGQSVWYAYGVEDSKCVPYTGKMASKLAAHLRHKQVDTCLPDLDIHANPNEKLKWARDKISEIIAEQALERFKIGITANPFKRWEFYSEEECEWTSVILIAVDLAERCVKVMEGSLIHHFRDLMKDRRCANQADGGEGDLLSGPPYFLYAVVRQATPPPRAERAKCSDGYWC